MLFFFFFAWNEKQRSPSHPGSFCFFIWKSQESHFTLISGRVAKGVLHPWNVCILCPTVVSRRTVWEALRELLKFYSCTSARVHWRSGAKAPGSGDWSWDCLVTSVIYCPRYLWATNSRHSSPWIDTAAVQSRNLIGTARPPSLPWRCTLLLLNLRIPPSSSSHPPPPASLRQPWERQGLRLKFVKLEQIYAGAARLLLCLLGPNPWTITAIVLNVAEKWTFPQSGYFLRVMFSQSDDGWCLAT